MKDYHDLYLKCDVLLVADVFEKFRNSSLKSYELCPSHYLSAPWIAMLNMTRVEHELISYADMYLFFEKGMRGGVSYISKEYSKTNNKYLKFYDPGQKSKHIMYLAVNNVYACSMSKFIPTVGFKWIDCKEFDSNKYRSNGVKICVLEVYVEYPRELCELHNAYSLAPDKKEIKKEMSNYQLKIVNFYKIHIGNVKKLLPNFFDKKCMCASL